MKHKFSTVIVSLFLVAFVGCSSGPKKPDGLPDLHPLALTLQQDGQPLTEAMVTLVPASGEFKWAVGGSSDAQGRVTVRTHGDFSGAPAGKYKVVVQKTTREGEKPVVEYDMVEEEYSSPTTTPLEIEVGTAPANVTLAVGKAVKNKRAGE